MTAIDLIALPITALIERYLIRRKLSSNTWVSISYIIIGAYCIGRFNISVNKDKLSPLVLKKSENNEIKSQDLNLNLPFNKFDLDHDQLKISLENKNNK